MKTGKCNRPTLTPFHRRTAPAAAPRIILRGSRYIELLIFFHSRIRSAPPLSNRRKGWAALLLVLALFSTAGCKRGRVKVLETDYVAAPQVNLRDRLSQIYNKTGVVKNGDRVEVLEKQRRFVRVRTSSGAEGWMEQRYLVGEDVYRAFQKMAADNANTPVQAAGVTRNQTNLHVEPGRDTDHLYLLPADEKLQLLTRATAPRQAPKSPPANSAPPPASPKAGQSRPPSPGAPPAAPPPAAPALEDWWLARDSKSHVGWILSRMVDLDVPMDIAQYAEGQRFVALFVLNQVQDADKKVPEYLAILTEPRDGQPFDYNQVRVFTWNVRRHRYETAYRERNLNGFLPVTIGHETIDKEGDLPIFILRVKDDSGVSSERKYKVNSPIVRRVLPPGEAKPASASHVNSRNRHQKTRVRRPARRHR